MCSKSRRSPGGSPSTRARRILKHLFSLTPVVRAVNSLTALSAAVGAYIAHHRHAHESNRGASADSPADTPDVDHTAWQPTISHRPNGTQTLVMRSLKSGIQTSCDIRWEILREPVPGR